MKKVRVLVVGQTPPPYHGQAIMIEKFVRAEFKSIEIIHLRLSFSDSIPEVGRFQLKKIIHLFSIILRGILITLKNKVDILYYPPAGPMWAPLLRDILLLPFLRQLAPKCIYHFRAGGLSLLLQSAPSIIQQIARKAYGTPDGAILLSQHNPKDGEYFGAKKIFVIPNGLEDSFKPGLAKNKERRSVSLLYVGVLMEEKGIFVLLEAARYLLKLHPKPKLHFIGEFDSISTERKFHARAKELEVDSCVELHGVLTGEAKWRLYAACDIVCFLSYYRAETFANVVLEGMMFGLPVVATRWRGIRDLVADGRSGFLVPPKDAVVAAEKIGLLARNVKLRQKMGRFGRKQFLEKYTLEGHLRRLEEAILEVCS